MKTPTRLAYDAANKAHDRFEDQYHKNIAPLIKEMETLRVALVKENFGIAPGVIVKTRKGEFRVVDIDFRCWWGPDEKPWATGNPKRKNGTFGTAIRNLYSDWELA